MRRSGGDRVAVCLCGMLNGKVWFVDAYVDDWPACPQSETVSLFKSALASQQADLNRQRAKEAKAKAEVSQYLPVFSFL